MSDDMSGDEVIPEGNIFRALIVAFLFDLVLIGIGYLAVCWVLGR